jgi:nitrite reductase/ring-hydroxylating ferredoxin subunit
MSDWKDEDLKMNELTKSNQPDEPVFSRRQLLAGMGGVSLLAALAGIAQAGLRFLMPPVSQVRPARVIAGSPADFPAGVLTPLAHSPVFVGRDEAGFFALSAVCTHLGCTVAHSGEGLACACHGSRFAANGTPLAGPAPEPLPYLALSLNVDGLLEIHLDQKVEAGVRLPEQS